MNQKPTIAELEALLDKPHRGYFINPDGSINDYESVLAAKDRELAEVRSVAVVFYRLALSDLQERLQKIHVGNTPFQVEVEAHRIAERLKAAALSRLQPAPTTEPKP